ncbi:hypothetical protein FOZ63_015412, partial [Perkinsus olseni]
SGLITLISAAMLVKVASVFFVYLGSALARLTRTAALRVDGSLRVPPLEASRIKLGIPAHLVENAGEDAVEGCLVKGKIDGRDSTMYMRVNEDGDTVVHYYNGDTSCLK